MRHRVMHVVPKHLVQIGFQDLLAPGGKQIQRTLIHLEHFEGGTAGPQAGRVLGQELADVGHAFGTPLIKKPLERAVVLQPE